MVPLSFSRRDRTVTDTVPGNRALCVANLLSVANTFGIHPESELHCIDPWTRYTDYEESYDHNDNYGKFLSNMAQFKDRSKVFVHRGYSNALIPTFPDGYFDIIYIDGNHETRYVLEDAVLCFKKLKVGGYLILDDYSFPTVGKAIDSFVDCYAKHLEVLGHSDIQVITKKVSE